VVYFAEHTSKRREDTMRKLALVVAILAIVAVGAQADDKTEVTIGKPAGPDAIGGPDPFGYKYIDSNEVSPYAPTFSWVTLTAVGTPLGLDDDGEATITTTNTYTFYGQTSNTFRVGNNGGILFGQTTGDVWAGNGSIPGSTITLPLIAPFWDDIDSETGNVYWAEFPACPHAAGGVGPCLVIEWFDRPHYSNVGSGTFEAFIYAAGPILFQYQDVDFGDTTMNNGVSATVGIGWYGGDPTWGLQYSYNTASIQNSMAILVTTGPVPVSVQSFAAE
jgi:hypothetical protein